MQEPFGLRIGHSYYRTCPLGHTTSLYLLCCWPSPVEHSQLSVPEEWPQLTYPVEEREISYQRTGNVCGHEIFAFSHFIL